ncbi:MAG: hypothetical protein LBJ01_05835 [Tannerella sp.]|jgi:hypothetical protein|nr:hypothetical protein [Tannerella sp.]
MHPAVLVYPFDNLFQDVKQESSLYAERKTDGDGNSLFEQLVFDEEYLEKFRELFLDARAEIAPALSAYMDPDPPAQGYFEATDFASGRDGLFHLLLPDSFSGALSVALDTNIRQFLIACIMYRWLETKAPADAALYFERAERLKKAVKSMLTVRPSCRPHGFWES